VVQLTSSLSFGVMRRWLVLIYGHFKTTFWSNLQGSSSPRNPYWSTLPLEIEPKIRPKRP